MSPFTDVNIVWCYIMPDEKLLAILNFIDQLDMNELSSLSGNRCDEDTRDALFNLAGISGCFYNPKVERSTIQGLDLSKLIGG